MARHKSVDPEKAAKKIIEMISKGEADSAAAAISQQPELESGLPLLNRALGKATKAQPVPRPAATGSGPARLTR